MSNIDSTFELLKNNYPYFFKNGHFDHRIAHQYIKDLSNKTIRVRYICNIYNMFLFGNNLIGTESQLYISSGLSTRKVAEYRCEKLDLEADEKNITKYRNKILYENRKYTSLFEININKYRSDNLIRIIMTYPEISEDLWKKINNAIITVLSEDTIYYLNSRFCIHFPKVKFNGEVNDKKLDELINLLKPYSSTVKKEFETDLKNYEQEIAYLSYILNPDSVLDKPDKERREALSGLFNEESVREYINSRHQTETDPEDIEDFEEIRDVITTQVYQERVLDQIQEYENEADRINKEVTKMTIDTIIKYSGLMNSEKPQVKEALYLVSETFNKIIRLFNETPFNNPIQYNKLMKGKLDFKDFVTEQQKNDNNGFIQFS